MTAKCINCQSENIIENDDPEMPFYCGDCGWWGMTENLLENPPPDDEERWREGPRKTRDDENEGD